MRVALTVGDFLRRAALVHGDRVAVVDEPGVAGSMGRLTYAEVHERARGMAAGLETLGIAPGERVAIVSPNSARFLISFFGVSGFGRVLVPINFRLNAEEVAYIVEHSGARVLLVDPEIAPSLSGVEVQHRILLDGVQDAPLFVPTDRATDVHIHEDDTATVNYTSGTTARPKGVQLTHRSLWLNAVTFGWHVGIGDRDRYLHTLPMFHCNGWGMPYAVTGMGGRHVVQRKVDGEQILERIEDEEVTLLSGAPAVVAAILDAAATRQSTGTTVPGRGTVRIVVAGAPPPSKIIERVQDELGWEFIQIYGLTETSPLLTINRSPYEWDGIDSAERADRLSRAGTPALGVQISVDHEGEVLARSNVVFEGYWEQPDASAAALDGGWLHTGDGGHLDGPYLVISDRKKDVIISGGENVSSIEVESCLFQHPAVAECAVIGVPDQHWGETVKALVVLRPGSIADEAELIAFTKERLAHFKCPTTVELREGLTRTATGKLQKFLLRQPYWEGREKQVN
ncbi:MAG TPA: AMP-binding protein [Acidimicrobiales bacterium]|jgi:acyl-CoA synthetase (AMP-forming)/AMP-acid ligase II